MKTIKVKLVGGMVVCALSFFGYSQINHAEKLDDLLLENIEALADDEVEINGKCIGSGSIPCPRSNEGVKQVIYY